MDIVGKQIFKGTVDKQFKSLSETSDSGDDGMSNEDRRRLQEQLKYDREKMMKEQDQRRADRAKAREEIRQKHNLKSNEGDQKVLKEAEALPWVEVDGEEDDVFTVMSNKIKSTWTSLTRNF